MQQKNHPDFTILLIGLIILIAAICSCKKVEIDNGHKCRWELCPYKNITPNNYGKAVKDYTGTDGGDAYSIDILHLEFPEKDYDELEQMLFED